MSSVLQGKSVLITGGAGSIGSEILRQTLAQGASKVVIFSRDEIKHFMMRKEIPDPRLETIVGDVRDLRSIEQVFNRFDIDTIYHAAAMKHLVMCDDFPIEAARTNVVGTQNVVDLALKYKVPRMITISTDKAAYPVNVLGATKFIAERITLNGNRESKGNQVFACVRFGNVAGSRGSVIPVFVANLMAHTPIQVSDPGVTRFIMEISDAVSLVLRATEHACGGEVFILKMRAFKLGELAEVITERIAPKLGITEKDVNLSVTGLVPGEKLHEELINDTELPMLHEMEDMYVVLSDSKVAKRYPNICKSHVTGYISCDAQMISKDDIEQLANNYLDKIFKSANIAPRK